VIVFAATMLCGEERLVLGRDNHQFQEALGLPEPLFRDLPYAVICRDHAWSKKEARRQAFRFVEAPAKWRAIVLLGHKTKTAFDHDRPFFSHEASSLNPDVQLVSLPSPKDRAWRDTRLVMRARQILREVIPALPWGAQHDMFSALGFSLRCAAECALWSWVIPAPLREKECWDEDDLMVALDAIEAFGLDRARGEYIARAGGKAAVA
jgi:hypothetical protein